MTTMTTTATMSTSSKLRAIAALGLPRPRVLCDNGDNTTYHTIDLTPEMAAWIQRHPEASIPDLHKTRPTAPAWRFGILHQMADHRQRALEPGYEYKDAAVRKYRETLESVTRAPFRPLLP